MARRPAGTVLQVFIFKGEEFLGTDVFVERQIVVGRDPELADLLLEDSSVSREHAMVTVTRNRIIVEDLGSTNGVILNDEEEVEEAEVTRFDEVGIGEFTLKFKLGRKGVRKGRPATRDLDDEEDEEAEEEEAPRRRAKKSKKASAKSGRGAATPKPVRQRRRAPEPEVLEEVETVQESEEALEPAPRAKRSKKAEAERPSKSQAKPKSKSKAPPPPPEEPDVEEPPGDATTIDASAAGLAKQIAELDSKPGSKPKSKSKAKPKSKSGAQLSKPTPSRGEAVEEVPKDFPPAEFASSGSDDDDDDDDDEDADETFVPAYSLIRRLLDEDDVVAEGAPAEVVEVIASRGERVIDVSLLRSGDTYWVGPRLGIRRRRKSKDLRPRVRMLKVGRGATCEVQFRKGAKGVLQRGPESLALKGAERKNRRGILVATLKSGELLDLDDSPYSYHVRYVTPPAKLTSAEQFAHVSPKLRPFARLLAPLKPSPLGARAIGGSLGFHLVVFIALAIFTAGTAETALSTGEFVEVAVAMEDMQLEEPEPEKPEPEKAKVKQEAKPNMEAAPTKKRARAGGTSGASAGVLGLLSKRGSSAAPGPAAAVAAVSNLSAARVPGAKGGFRVSSLMGRMPTSRISVGGGGGGPVTKGALALLRGGSGGAGRLAGGKGTRKVGGMVTKVPKAMRAAGQGSLDRDEIQKVINKGISQIQRCYERELLRSPGLSGKVQVEWTISTSGSVRTVRQAFSSLSSSSAVSCIMGKIKGWRFPKPRGGEVVVNYPFIFKAVGY